MYQFIVKKISQTTILNGFEEDINQWYEIVDMESKYDSMRQDNSGLRQNKTKRQQELKQLERESFQTRAE